MAITADELRVVVNAEVKRAVRDLKKFDKSMDRTSRRASGAAASIKSVFSKLAIAASAAVIARQAARIGAEMIALASNAEEVQSKFNVVFGATAVRVESWARRFGNSVGVATTDIQGFLASIQDTLVPLGVATTKAADMSTEIVTLARDLASFNNLPTEQVIRDIQSALVGNTETLRKYGIVASQARIEQYALNTGMIDARGELNATTKAMAIYQLAFKDSEAAIGDAIRTQESFANQLVRLQSNVKELKEGLGALLTEGLRPVLSEVNEALEGWNLEGQILEATKAMADGARDVDTLSLALQGQEQQVGELRKQIVNLMSARTGEGFSILDSRIRKLQNELALQEDIQGTLRRRLTAAKLIQSQAEDEQRTQEAIAEAIKEQAQEAEALASARRAEAEARKEAIEGRFLANRAKVLAILKSEQTELERLQDEYDYLADASNAWAAGGMLEEDRQRALEILAGQIAELSKNTEDATENIREFFKLGDHKTLIENVVSVGGEVDNVHGAIIGDVIPAIEDAAKEVDNLKDEFDETRQVVQSLAISLIDDLGNALRTGDVSRLAEGLGGAIGSAVGMIAGGPVGAAIGQQLGSFLGSLIDGAVATPEFIKSAEDAMAALDSTFASVIASGGGLDEFSDALDAKLRQVIVDQLIKSIRLEKDLKKLGKAMAKALEDGVVTAEERSDIQGMMASIKAKGEAVSTASNDLFNQFGIAPSSNEEPRSRPDPQPYIGPQQTAGGAQRGGGDVYVTVNGSVMREDEITDSIFANGHRRGVA